MDQDANPYRDPSEPLPQPPPAPPGRRRVPRAALTVGLASFLAMAGAGVAFAVGGSGSSNSSTTSPSASSPNSASPVPAYGRGPGFRGGHGFAMMGPMGGGVVHGIYTVPNGSSYKTVETQVGTVQASSSSSLTVLSADKYSQTYKVQATTIVNSQAGGISTVVKGDTVRVEAVQDANGFTATDVVDTTRISSSRQGFGWVAPTPPAPQGSTSAAVQ